MKYYGFIFLMILFGVILYFPDINFIKMRETFQNLATMNQPLLYDSYRPNYRHNGVSANTYNDIWWHYPSFGVGSYKQTTNNLKYFKNPDEGTCVGAEFCGAFYKDKRARSNEIKILAEDGLRVGYFRAR